MEILNYTPHAITVVSDTTEDGVTEFPSVGVARVSSTISRVGEHAGILFTRQSFGEVTGLPPQTKGVWLIVSRLVAAACPNRTDLLVPGNLIRDNEGRVTATESLEAINYHF